MTHSSVKIIIISFENDVFLILWTRIQGYRFDFVTRLFQQNGKILYIKIDLENVLFDEEDYRQT